MNPEDLLKAISQTLTKEKVAKLAAIASNSEVAVSDLIDITFHRQREIAFRAAWILEDVATRFFSRFVPHLSHFISVYPQQKNRSCQRHYTKILMLKPLAEALDDLPDDIVEPLVDTTFEWLLDPETPVAVKVNCMDILLRFNNRYNWIADELTPQVELLLKDGSAAMQSRGKKVLKKLQAGSCEL